jgi:Domain of unknown function (DUF3330).
MNDLHRNPSGAPVLPCADDAGCETLSCEMCLKEIPADAAEVADVQDYIHHFCGLDCLEAWKKQRKPAR